MGIYIGDIVDVRANCSGTTPNRITKNAKCIAKVDASNRIANRICYILIDNHFNKIHMFAIDGEMPYATVSVD